MDISAKSPGNVARLAATGHQARHEATSCLNQCGKGPNLTLHKADRSQVQLSGVSGPMHLAEELEEHFEVRVPSKLVAAVTVMEKAKKGMFLARE